MSIRSVLVIIIAAIVISAVTVTKSKISNKKDLERFNKTVSDNEEDNMLKE